MKDLRGLVAANGSVDAMVGDHQAETTIERATPWVSSFLMHMGLGLVGAFVVYAAMSPRVEPEKQMQPLGITDVVDPVEQMPTAKTDEALAKLESVRSMQDKIRDARSGVDAFAPKESMAKTLAGMGVLAPTDVPLITTGPGASMGPGDGIRRGDGPGSLAGYGPLVDGNNKVGSVIPTSRARKTVYLLDHSGSMMESFDYLRQEVKSATEHLIPAQQFSVIMFSEEVEVLGPDALQRATPAAKRDVANRIGKMRAQGQNDGLLAPFQNGFEKAFAMHPDVIIFLTDGQFDVRLVDVVKSLNKPNANGRKTQIETIAYVQIDPEAAACLKKIAADNGGKYKFVSDKDLQR